jgi:hypothetical protein
MNAFLFVCALIGATLLVARSTVFRPIQRLWPALFQCCQCVGVWIGAGAAASGIVTTGHGLVIDVLIVSSATSFAAMLADAVLLKLLGDPT